MFEETELLISGRKSGEKATIIIVQVTLEWIERDEIDETKGS